MYPENRKAQKKAERNEKRQKQINELNYEFVTDLKNISVKPSLKENKEILQNLFANCSDIAIREFKIEKGISALAVFVDGLVNTELVNEALKSLMILEGGTAIVEQVSSTTLPVSQMQTADNYTDLILSVLGGDTGVFVEHNKEALLLGIRGASVRSVSEPESETAIRGPREGFIENLRTNTSLVRRKLKTPRLKMKSLTIGKQTNTNIVVAYLEGICPSSVVEEVQRRLAAINIDGILESGYIEELIQDNAFSPFPQIQYTERPDTLVASLLEGRAAIMIDGTPFTLIVPTVFWTLMQASEDYYTRFQMSTLIRWIRYLFLVVSLTTPALYIAITTYHQDMIPTTLLLSIAGAREAIPFPAVVEALIMEITFEALREAGIRLPRAVGQAVSILGALVVGQAAVEAGIVSAPMVIVVSITGIASFTIPRFNGAIALRMLRFPILIIASVFGIYGILLSIIFLFGHLANLRSFGVPYLSPVSPLSAGDMKDVLIRAPWWAMEKRPSFMPLRDQTRLGKEMKDKILEQNGQNGQNGQEAAHAGPSQQEDTDGKTTS